MANNKQNRINQAKDMLSIISERLIDARLTDQFRGIVLYLDDGHVFKLEITKELKRGEMFEFL